MSENQENLTQGTETPVQSDSIIGGLNTPDTIPTSTSEAPKSFLEMVSEELRDIPALKKFGDVESLAKSYINAEKLIGKKVSDLSPEELRQVMGKALNAPESPDGYDLGDIDGDKEFFQTLAHELQLSTEQAKNLATKLTTLEKESVQQSTELLSKSRQEAEEILAKDWGKQVERNKKLAGDAIVEFGGKDLAKVIDEAGLGNNVQLLKAFAKIGENFLESKFVGETGMGNFGMTPDQARDARMQLFKDPEFVRAWRDSSHPNHKANVQKAQEYTEIELGLL